MGAQADSPITELPTTESLGADDDGEHQGRSARKTRQNFTCKQLAVLECVFNSTPLPRKAIRAQLAEQLGLPQRSVQVWFQNRCGHGG